MHIKNRRWLRFAAVVAAHHGSGLTAAGSELVAVEPAGSYEISGVRRDGSRYVGSLVIVKLAGEALYRLEWSLGGGESHVGTGALVGNKLYVVWAAQGVRCFVVLFEAEPQGTLNGIWVSASDGSPATGTEIAVPEAGAGRAGVAGDYTVTGARADGSPYERLLRISPAGEHYRFLWQGDDSYEGLGTVEGALIHVVAAPAGEEAGPYGKAVIELSADDTFVGTWMVHDADFRKLGSERGVRR